MTSPTETAPIATTAPEKGSDESVVIGGVRIPLPRWAKFLIGIVALIGAVVPIAVTYIPRKPPVVPEAKKDDQAILQYREFGKHFNETPEYTQTLFDSPDLGSLVTKFYQSDGCLLVLRKNPGRYQDQIPFWLPKKAIEAEKAPGSISQSQKPTADSTFMLAQVQIPVLNLAKMTTASAPGISTAPPAGNCLNPHPYDFRSWSGEQRGCWLQVWRAWADGCQHYQWFNTCGGYWDSDQFGAPRVYWTNCAH